MDNPQEVRELLVKYGLEEKADALMALVRPSIRIFTQPADDAELPVGVSKIGGEPDLPPGFEWPMWEHEPPDWLVKSRSRFDRPLPEKIRPLGFLGQFNLLEVAPYDVEHLLPSSGMLYFFYDNVEQPWTESLGEGARVYYHEVTELKRRPSPDNLPNESRFKSCILTVKQELTLPSLYSPSIKHEYHERFVFPDAINLSKEEVEGYEAVEQSIVETWKTRWQTTHRLLGHPQPVQNDVEVDCEVKTSSIYFHGDFDEKQQNVIKNARRWRLLFQIDSDSYAGMMWGDVGKLYFCLPEDALQAKQFETGAMILQCH